jgi:hypothetical protein
MRPVRAARLFGAACLISAMVLGAPGAVSSLADLELARVLDLGGVTHHVQGVDFDSRHLWATSVDSAARKGWLHEFSLATGEQIRDVEIEDGERFHAGGMAADSSSLWIPVAEYRANSSSVIQRRSQRTLRLEFQFAVADHIGCVAATPRFLIGGNWDSREFYIWDRRGRLIRKAPNTAGNGYQDMKFDGGQIVASGLLPGGGGAIDWLDLPSLRLARRLAAGNTSRGDPYTREGMAIHAGLLALLPEDGPSRVFFFRLNRR